VILADTTVWVDHLRNAEPTVSDLLRAEELVMHSSVLGEILLGNFRNRQAVAHALGEIPKVARASDEDVIRLIERHQLYGTGVGFVDAHLVATCLLTRGTYLWTRDRKLAAVADRLGVSAETA
jgi:predicted nucleic acid-binding protein